MPGSSERANTSGSSKEWGGGGDFFIFFTNLATLVLYKCSVTFS